ncbi:MAG TPA: DUF4185 domain-containing protein [Acidobacteriaceae bacterium]|nr:DUF4185 domain-containing protein [Acidobacteriaceae bacterium]
MMRLGWFARFCLVSAALAGLLCARAQGADAPCTPDFPLQTGQALGWQGADVAYSVPLADGRDLWIFGDTLYGRQRVVQANVPAMVRNSIGVSTCHGGRWKIRYAIRRDAQGKPADFFHAQHPNSWYWALDGFRVGSDVWVTLLCVRATDAKSAMGFATCGSDLARIESPGPDPQRWKVSYFPLVADGAHAYPSATTVVDGTCADLFALDEQGSRPLIAARVPVNGLDDPRQNLEYLARDGRWLKGFNPANARAVMTPGISELSIRYHPELGRWLAVMFDPAAFSAKILLRSAPAATGPWSEGQTIYSAPEMQPGTPGYDKDTFCYAGKEHPEFEHGDLVFTYVCNTFSVPKLATDLNIYFPRVVRMPMPPLPEASAAR